ncbi:MAG TPA: hypothetical protein VGB43_01245 [Flavobacterium sp.]
MKEFKLDEKSNDVFKVPENYFENFQERIMHKIDLPEKGVISLWRKNRWMYVAASVIIIILFISIFKNIITNQHGLSETEIALYLSEIKIDDEVFADLLDAHELSQIDIVYTIEDAAIEEILSNNDLTQEYILE